MSFIGKLKQFKDLKEKAKALQDQLSTITSDGSAGWGKVKVTINGTQQVTQVLIDDEMMADKVKLQGFLKDAFNDAAQKLQQILANKMREGGGMDLMSEFGEMMKGGQE